MRWILAGAMGICAAAFGAEAELLRFDCVRANGPIVIDGSGEDAAWAEVPTIRDFKLWRTLETPALSTTVKICYDAEAVYLFYECEDPDVFTIYTERDSRLWECDVVEFFAGPVEESPIYYEFEFAPNGTIFDARFVNQGSGNFPRWSLWDCEVQVATKVRGTLNHWEDEDEGYTVEVAIPRAAFSDTIGDAALTGQTWRFAAVRMEFSKNLAREEGHITANCVDGSFHTRSQWYYLTFR